jgi:peroxiredoxin
MAPIAVGDKIPDGVLYYLNSDGKPTAFHVYESLKGKKVVLVAAPGAFTPTCSLKHIPSFLDNAEAIKAKGVDEILVLTVNDPFVVSQWEKSYSDKKDLKFLADGSAEYTKALGLELDLSGNGMGIRSKRYALLIDDLIVKIANVEKGGEFVLSGGEDILSAL